MEEEVLGKAYDGRLMRRLLAYVKPYKIPVAAALVLLFFNAILQAIGPLLTALAVDRYLAPSAKQSHTILDPYLSVNPWTGLAQISFIYLAVVIFGMFCDFGEQYIMQWVGQKAMFDLRRELMDRLQRLDLAFYDHNPVGRLVTRITTDVDALNELFSSGLLMILGDLLMLSFVIVAMLELSPGMTALLLAVMPLVVLVTMRFRRSVQQSYRRIRVAIARINSYLQEHINGIAVLQLFNREARSRAEFEHINRDHMDAYKDAIIAYGWFYPVVEFFGMLALALLLAYGGFRMRGGALQIGAYWSPSSNMACDSSAPFRISAKNTTSCNRPWPPPSASSNCWTRRCSSNRPPSPSRSRNRPRPSNSITSGSHIKMKTGC